MVSKLRKSKLGRYPFWEYIRLYRRQYAIGLGWLLVVDAINVVLPLLIKVAVDAIPARQSSRLMIAAVAYLGLMLVQSAGRYAWRVYLMGSAHRIANDLRTQLYGHLQRLPLAHYQKARTGDLMSRATNDIESVRMAVGPGILVTVDALLMFAMIVPVMLYFSLKLTLLAFAFFPIVPFLTARLGKHIDVLFESLQTRMSRLSAHAQESFVAIRLIKSLVLEGRVFQRFRLLSGEYRVEGMKLARYEATFSPALGFLTNMGTFLILLLGGLDVLHGAITIGTFVAFQRFVVQLSWPMEAIGWAVTMNQEGQAALRRIQDLLRTPPVESVRAGAAPVRTGAPLLQIQNLRHAIAGSPFTLAIDRLEIGRGRKIGVVGAVGSGKSTLFQLLLRLSEPPAGAVFLEGRDVVSIPLPELRERVASVEQQVALFSESIRANLVMGVRQSIEPSEVQRAVETAAILDEVLELHQGFETLLGERGVNLSGGQKQRLALARALVRRPELLLVDDAFSAVDVAIEEKIIQGLFKQYPETSLCFASHRLSVMTRMDEIWLLQEGKVIARAPHGELLQSNALYRALWEKSERERDAEAIGGALEVSEVLPA